MGDSRQTPPWGYWNLSLWWWIRNTVNRCVRVHRTLRVCLCSELRLKAAACRRSPWQCKESLLQGCRLPQVTQITQCRRSQDGLAPGTGVLGNPGLLQITATMLALIVFFSLHICFILPQETSGFVFRPQVWQTVFAHWSIRLPALSLSSPLFLSLLTFPLLYFGISSEGNLIGST